MKQRRVGVVSLALLLVLISGFVAGGRGAPLAAAPLVDGSPVMRFDRTRYNEQDQATLRLWDEASNANPAGIDELEAAVYARLSGEMAVVKLVETGPNSGTFEGFLLLGPNGLKVDAGDLIAALVVVGDDQPHALAAALVNGGQATGAFTFKIDPKLLPASMETTPTPDPQVNLPVAAVRSPDGAVGFMGADQVVFGPVGEELLQDFVNRRGAQELAAVELPLAPENDPQESETAVYHLYRLDVGQFDLANLPYMMEMLGFEGEYVYSSEEAASLVGLLVEEQLAGNAAAPHALLQYQGAPVTNEGRDDGAGPENRDIFSLTWFDPRATPSNEVGLGEALTVLDVLDARETRPQVPLAIIDGGFAGPGDYTGPLAGLNNPDIGDINGDRVVTFNEVPQCDIDPFGGANCAPGAAAGPNPLPCSGTGGCPWHGMGMFSGSAAEIDNGFGSVGNNGSGSAGSGAYAASPIFMRVGFPYMLPVASGIARSTALGAGVINISSGFPCGIVLVDWCNPVQVGGLVGLLTPVLLAHCDLLRAFVPLVGPLPCEQLLVALFAIPVNAAALHAAVLAAEASGVLIVAAAGNQVNIAGVGTFGPFAPADVHLVPCVLGDVLCVGELVSDGTNLVRAANHGFGAGVDIYAPVLPTTADPANPFGRNTTIGSRGTSGATAFVSGLAAQVRSLNPALARGAVKGLVVGAGCRPGDTALTLGGNCAPTPNSVPLNPNDTPGGYVDALETVHRALASTGPVPPGIAICSGGWDEVTAAADSAATAISLVPVDGGDDIYSVTMTGDLSVHEMPSDQDWYRFRLPAGFTTTDARITLTTAGPFGNLALRVYRGPAGSLTPVSPAAPANVPLLVSGLTPGVDHFVQVTTTGTPNDDNCYGGGSLTVEIARAATGDRFEPNNSTGNATLFSPWQHLDWICGSELRGQFPPQARLRRCADVFENGPAPRSAVDFWWIEVENLSINSVNDEDFYRIRLPDYTDPAEGGHDDIRPTRPPVPPTPEALFECGTTTREAFVPGGVDPTINVNVRGRLFVEIVPEPNALSARAVATGGETLGLYRRGGGGWLRTDALGNPPSPTLFKEIRCPQEELDLRELIFSFGERAAPRGSVFATGGYKINVGYQIIAERGTPDTSSVFPGLVGPLPCFASGGGFPGAGFSFFPNCGAGPGSPFDLFGTHPIDVGDFAPCLADGPGCLELFSVDWPQTVTRFDVSIDAPNRLGFRLLDEQLQPVAVAQPVNGAGPQAAAAKLRMNAGELEAGRYYLEVAGPPAEYLLNFRPPAVEDGPESGRLFLPVVRR